MITSFSFMHIRSLVGLAKQCRNKMRNLRKTLIQLGEIRSSLKKAQDEGDIDSTHDDLIKLLKIYEKQEEYRKITEEDEFKIELEEIRKELADNSKMKALLDRLKSSHPDLAAILDSEQKEYAKIIQETRTSVKQIVSEELDMLRNRESRIKYMRLMGDKFQAGQAFNDLVDEVKRLRADAKEEEVIISLFYRIEESMSKKDNAAIDKYVKELVSEMKKEGEIRKKIFQDITDALHFLHLIYSHLLLMMDENNPQGMKQGHIEKLKKEGYPVGRLKDVEEEYNKLRGQVDKDSRSIFRMAKWVGLEMNTGIEQS